MKKLSEIFGNSPFWIFFCFFCSLFLIVNWHLTYPYYPKGDIAVYYFESTIPAYNIFNESGLWMALKSLFWERTFKGFSVPVFEFFGLMATRGDVMASTDFISISFFSLLVFYTYKNSRLFLNRFISSLLTIFMCYLPIIVEAGEFPDSILYFIIFLNAALFHLLKSDYFRNRNHSLAFGVFIGVVLTVRPVETVLNLLLPFLPVFISMKRRQIISNFDLYAVPGLFVWETSLLLSAHFIKPFKGSTALLLTLAFIPFIVIFHFHYRHKQNHHLWTATSIFTSMAMIWWLPLDKIFNWINAAAYGFAALQSQAHNGDSGFAVFQKIYQKSYSHPYMWLLPTAALLVLRILTIKRNFTYNPWYLFAVLSIILMPIASFFTKTVQPIYHIGTIWAAHFALTLFVFTKDSLPLKPIRAFMIGFCCFTAVRMFDHNFDMYPTPWKHGAFVDSAEDPMPKAFDQIVQQIPKANPFLITSIDSFENYLECKMAIEWGALNARAIELKSQIRFRSFVVLFTDLNSPDKNDELKQLIKNLRNNFDYIVTCSDYDVSKMPEPKTASVLYTRKIFAALNDPVKLNDLGLQKISEYSNDLIINKNNRIFLFKVLKQ